MDICECNDPTPSKRNSLYSICSEQEHRKSRNASQFKGQARTHEGWKFKWIKPGKTVDIIKAVVPGPFARPKILKAFPYIVMSECRDENSPLARLRNGIPDPWLDYLTARDVDSGKTGSAFSDKSLSSEYVRYTDYIWNRKGLPFVQGIPDPWKFMDIRQICQRYAFSRIKKKRKPEITESGKELDEELSTKTKLNMMQGNKPKREEIKYKRFSGKIIQVEPKETKVVKRGQSSSKASIKKEALLQVPHDKSSNIETLDESDFKFDLINKRLDQLNSELRSMSTEKEMKIKEREKLSKKLNKRKILSDKFLLKVQNSDKLVDEASRILTTKKENKDDYQRCKENSKNINFDPKSTRKASKHPHSERYCGRINQTAEEMKGYKGKLKYSPSEDIHSKTNALKKKTKNSDKPFVGSTKKLSIEEGNGKNLYNISHRKENTDNYLCCTKDTGKTSSDMITHCRGKCGKIIPVEQVTDKKDKANYPCGCDISLREDTYKIKMKNFIEDMDRMNQETKEILDTPRSNKSSKDILKNAKAVQRLLSAKLDRERGAGEKEADSNSEMVFDKSRKKTIEKQIASECLREKYYELNNEDVLSGFIISDNTDVEASSSKMFFRQKGIRIPKNQNEIILKDKNIENISSEKISPDLDILKTPITELIKSKTFLDELIRNKHDETAKASTKIKLAKQKYQSTNSEGARNNIEKLKIPNCKIVSRKLSQKERKKDIENETKNISATEKSRKGAWCEIGASNIETLKTFHVDSSPKMVIKKIENETSKDEIENVLIKQKHGKYTGEGVSRNSEGLKFSDYIINNSDACYLKSSYQKSALSTDSTANENDEQLIVQSLSEEDE